MECRIGAWNWTTLLLLAACARPVAVDFGPARDDGAALVKACGFEPAQTGLLVFDPERRASVLDHDRGGAFVPASVTKVATALVAFDVFGAGHRFTTRVTATAPIEDGVVRGDVCLVGGGDPTLTVVDFARISARLRATGLRRVTGDFFFDELALATNDAVSPTMEPEVPYNPGLGALGVEWNVISVDWATKDGKLTSWLVPDVPTARAADPHRRSGNPYLFGFAWRDGRETWTLPDGVADQGRDLVPVKRPGLYAAHVFRRVAALDGIELGEPRPGRVPASSRVLVAYQGAPLVDIAEQMLLYSNNMIAETLFLAAAQELAGRKLARAEAGPVVAAHLAARVRGVDWTKLALANGSGLTSANRMTPEQLVALLVYAERRTYTERPFITLLPASGFRGSLARRLSRPETQLRVWAKTGAINYAIGLAGEIHAVSGRRYLFAFFHHDLGRRLLADRWRGKPAPAEAAAAYGWMDARLNALDLLVTQLVKEY